jgi:hypothetical protein
VDPEVDPAAAALGLSIHQLALPLANAPPALPALPTTVPAALVWAGLAPAAREGVARAVRTIFREVAGDADRG